jgi:ferrous iron transport protein B
MSNCPYCSHDTPVRTWSRSELPHEGHRYVVALAGNPNAGKTTLFNALTGARQHVGNWPGKTVEKKAGLLRYQGVEFEIVDLPGTYSLSAFSPEEVVARDFILQTHPDLVVNVLDAGNLERNLYLTVQLLELGAPMLIVLNQMDMARAAGIAIDRAQLSALLGHTPVIATVGNREQGIAELVETILHLVQSCPHHPQGGNPVLAGTTSPVPVVPQGVAPWQPA